MESNVSSDETRDHCTDSPEINRLIKAQLLRRTILQGSIGLTLGSFSTWANEQRGVGPDPFPEIEHIYLDRPDHADLAKIAAVGDNHRFQVLIKWGDSLSPDVNDMDIQNHSAVAQASQFGYNNDFIAFLPLPQGSSSSDHGLLCVNHEYTNAELMFEGILPETRADLLSQAQVDTEMAAHGHSILEIRRVGSGDDLQWAPVIQSSYNRRIHAETRVRISGPAAGHPRMRTNEDPTGRHVRGILNNCAGGVTPWGTVLSGEENFQYYFGGNVLSTNEVTNYVGFELDLAPSYGWYRFYSRFNVESEPNEPNRFGWVVEIDPYDPGRIPVKRTALGRIRHEGAATAVSSDGRVAVYMGDDQRFEFLYRFLTARPFDSSNREANRDLFDDGTLAVAKFHDDGTMNWLPLVFGEGPLVSENGFKSQADVLIDTRLAARLLGATGMDRPEDVESNPVSGHVYVMLTNNSIREEPDASNPRAANIHGHILELEIPRDNGKPNHGASTNRWSVFLKAGSVADDGGWYQGSNPSGWVSCPDNCTFDNSGRLWITTDGASAAAGFTDGIYVADTAGPERGLTRLFFRAPVGAEVCGPCFTPDCSTLFAAIQHPGEGGTFDAPLTRWPNDPDSNLPPMPAVVAITKKGNGTIASR